MARKKAKKNVNNINIENLNEEDIIFDESLGTFEYYKATKASGEAEFVESYEYKSDYRNLNSESFLGMLLDSNGYIDKAYACGILHSGQVDEKVFCLEADSEAYSTNSTTINNELQTYYDLGCSTGSMYGGTTNCYKSDRYNPDYSVFADGSGTVTVTSVDGTADASPGEIRYIKN